MTISQPNSFIILLGGRVLRKGLITGMKAGVSTVPPFVRRRPILPMRSLSRSSNDTLLEDGARRICLALAAGNLGVLPPDLLLKGSVPGLVQLPVYEERVHECAPGVGLPATPPGAPLHGSPGVRAVPHVQQG